MPMKLENKTIIMGVLNVTPDSFADGGKFSQIDAAVQQVKVMLEAGADIIDIGGESTRPGALDVSIEDELQRVIPIIRAIRNFSDCVISIDTSKPHVMRDAIAAGANMINDVRALQEANASQVAAELDVPICIMHMQGQPRSMQAEPQYENVVKDVQQFLIERIKACVDVGIRKDNVIIDPGFGFGKTLQQNLELFRALDEFVKMGYPVLVGVSRKSMLGKILNDDSSEKSVNERIYASVVMAAMAAQQAVKIVRVHDVKATADALAVIDSLN